LGVDLSVKKAKGFTGGSSEAERRLDEFLKNKLASYPGLRNDPTVDFTSNLSPYLHFWANLASARFAAGFGGGCACTSKRGLP
jgi:hypothetical protein